MRERRQFLRTKFDSRVKVVHPSLGNAIFRTGDVSDGGIFLQKGPFELELGDTITVQIQDLPGEAPVVKVTVVRLDAGGFGLRFAE